MKLAELEPNTPKSGKAIILSEDTPQSLEIDGSDVDGVPDDYVFEAGSILVTPSANYIAFDDGEFTQKA